MPHIDCQLGGIISKARIALSLLFLLLASSVLESENRCCAEPPKQGQARVKPAWSPYRPLPPGSKSTVNGIQQRNEAKQAATSFDSSESVHDVEPIPKGHVETPLKGLTTTVPPDSSVTNATSTHTPDIDHGCSSGGKRFIRLDDSQDFYTVWESDPYNNETSVPNYQQDFTCHYPLLSDRLWLRGEYLLWWLRGANTPPLLTTSPAVAAGRLNDPSTIILFGSERVDSGVRSGGRLTLGYWLDVDQHFAVEANYLGIGKGTARYPAASNGNPLLARPFLNIVTGAEDSQVFAFAPFLQGSIAINSSSEFHSTGIWLRRALFVKQDCRIDGFDSRKRRMDFLLGYRFNRLNEDLQIGESLEAAGPTAIDAWDLFDTENTFHGAELGFSTEFRYCRWSLEFLMKLGFGNTHSEVLIDGSTTTTVGGGAPVTDSGGLLALSTNVGRYSQDHFTVVPELGVTIAYDITSRLRATFGYTFIYWSRVARPGDQIDRYLNPSYIPNNGPPIGPARPAFTFATSNFWAQGMNFGMEYRF